MCIMLITNMKPVTFLNLKSKFLRRHFSTSSMKWRTALRAVLPSLTALIFVRILFLHMMSPIMPSRRPKTEITFDNRELCTLTTAAQTHNLKTVVIVVLSARAHFNQRMLVRQTYGSIKTANNVNLLAVIFMLGNMDKPDIEATDPNQLEAERNRFGDIVMGDFVDSYRNLTLKTIMAYEWISYFCREAQFVLKTDDDVLINIFKLTEILDASSPAAALSSNIWCAVHVDESTVKDAASRFYVPPEEFEGGVFPTHCGGLGYITTMGVIDRIVDEVSKSFLGYVCTHEDVFMTAVVPRHMESIHNTGQYEPITLVDKYEEWISMDLENGRGDEDHFLSNLVDQQTVIDETENLERFRKRYGLKVIYLLSNLNYTVFEMKYLRLWQIIEKTFSH